MNKANAYFKDTILKISEHGVFDKNPRPKWKDGTPAYTKFITHVYHQYDLSKNEFPIVTLRPLAFKSAIGELLWIYQDQSNSLDLLNDKYNIKWWNEFNIGDNTIGERYGKTVSNYNIIEKLLHTFTHDIESRRKIINLWQENDFDKSQGLKPCFYNVNFEVRDGYLDMFLLSRSSDFITAYSINCVQYVCLQMIFAKLFNLKLGKFSIFISNCHIYDRHLQYVEELLSRVDNSNPIIQLKDFNEFKDVTINHFSTDFKCKFNQLNLELAI